MNEEKTEFLYFGSSRQLAKCKINTLKVNGTNVQKSRTTRYLRSYVDKELKFNDHVTCKCQTAMGNLIKIKEIRKYLTKEACTTITLALVTSHLDYCNSLLIGTTQRNIKKMQQIQNLAAKIILRRKPQDSAISCL